MNTNLSILAPKNFKIKKKTNFNKSVKIYKNIKNIKKLLCKFDHIITSCGGLSYETNFLGIECTYITSEPKEMRLAKFFERKKFGNYFDIRQNKEIINNINSSIKNSNRKKTLNKIRYFRHNGLINILSLIKKIKNEIQV